MKQLSILRHAKANDATSATSDFERDLTERGRQDLQLLAKVLKPMKPPIEWILSSSAVRCKQTTETISPSLRPQAYINWQVGIYEASPGTLLRLLMEIPDGIEHALLVGHNPGVEELVAGLCHGAEHHMTIRMATATLAYLELDIFSWNQIRWGCGTLQSLIPPKMLR